MRCFNSFDEMFNATVPRSFVCNGKSAEEKWNEFQRDFVSQVQQACKQFSKMDRNANDTRATVVRKMNYFTDAYFDQINDFVSNDSSDKILNACENLEAWYKKVLETVGKNYDCSDELDKFDPISIPDFSMSDDAVADMLELDLRDIK